MSVCYLGDRMLWALKNRSMRRERITVMDGMPDSARNLDRLHCLGNEVAEATHLRFIQKITRLLQNVMKNRASVDSLIL